MASDYVVRASCQFLEMGTWDAWCYHFFGVLYDVSLYGAKGLLSLLQVVLILVLGGIALQEPYHTRGGGVDLERAPKSEGCALLAARSIDDIILIEYMYEYCCICFFCTAVSIQYYSILALHRTL